MNQLELEEGEILIISESPQQSDSSVQYIPPISKNSKKAICRAFLGGKCKPDNKCPFSHHLNQHPCPSFSLLGKCELKKRCQYKHTSHLDKHEQIRLIEDHSGLVEQWVREGRMLKLHSRILKQLPMMLNNKHIEVPSMPTVKPQQIQVKVQPLPQPQPLVQLNPSAHYPYERLQELHYNPWMQMQQQQVAPPAPNPIIEQFKLVAQNDPSAHSTTEFLITAIKSKLQELLERVIEKVPVIRFLKLCVETTQIDAQEFIRLLNREPRKLPIILLLQQIEMNPYSILLSHMPLTQMILTEAHQNPETMKLVGSYIPSNEAQLDWRQLK